MLSLKFDPQVMGRVKQNSKIPNCHKLTYDTVCTLFL